MLVPQFTDFIDFFFTIHKYQRFSWTATTIWGNLFTSCILHFNLFACMFIDEGPQKYNKDECGSDTNEHEMTHDTLVQ